MKKIIVSIAIMLSFSSVAFAESGILPNPNPSPIPSNVTWNLISTISTRSFAIPFKNVKACQRFMKDWISAHAKNAYQSNLYKQDLVCYPDYVISDEISYPTVTVDTEKLQMK